MPLAVKAAGVQEEKQQSMIHVGISLPLFGLILYCFGSLSLRWLILFLTLFLSVDGEDERKIAATQFSKL